MDGNCQVIGYSAEVGNHTLAAVAKDNAGNEAAIEEISYTVKAWTIKGFYSPVDMNGIVNTVKAGKTVPLKFEVFAGEQEKRDTDLVKSFAQERIGCISLLEEPTDAIEEKTTDETVLRYDLAAGQFIQNWKTPNSANTCWKVTVTTDDGTLTSALFRLTE